MAEPPREHALDEMVEPVVPSRFRWLARLLDAGPGARIVDLGCGTGAAFDAILSSLADPSAGSVIGLDSSVEALRTTGRGLAPWPATARLLIQADLNAPLPVADAAADRVLCHNVLECLPDQDALLREAHRVLRPGGKLLLSHSDFDALVFACEPGDLALTRRLVHAYCDTQQAWMDAVDGTVGRRLVEIVGRSPLVVETVDAAVVLSRRFQPGELGYGYAHNLVSALTDAGAADPAELERWLAGLRRMDERGAFLFSVNDYAVVCRRPWRRHRRPRAPCTSRPGSRQNPGPR